MADLRVSDSLSLPLDLVVQKSALLARSGAGKTNTAVVIAEELLVAGQQVVILDPPGAWWGLRSSADGAAAGFPIVVLGGIHGDLPLEATAGALIADLVVDQGISAVLDLSEFTWGEMAKFVPAFCQRLYHRKNRVRDPMLLIVEEADELAPQRPEANQTLMLAAVERIAKRGRMRGIGLLAITQRSAALNKHVLSQIEVLIALQTTDPRDIKAIDEWVERTGDQERRRQLLAEIAQLPVGTAFLWSPAWLRTFQKVSFRRRRTFDSSATPEPGKRQVMPKELAAVDLEHLRTRMAETVERAKENDPAELKRQLEDLRRQSRAAPVITEREKIVEVQVPVLAAEQIAEVRAIADGMTATGMRLIDAAGEIKAALLRVESAPTAVKAAAAMTPRVARVETPAKAPTRTVPAATLPAMDVKLSLAERKVLSVLAQYPEGRTKTQVAILTGYASGGGGFNNALSALRTKGFLSGSKERLVITDAGQAALGPVEPLPTGQALVEHWLRQLPKAERAILEYLVNGYPKAMSKEDLAEETGYKASGGGFNNALSRLRTLELIERGEPRASAAFFE